LILIWAADVNRVLFLSFLLWPLTSFAAEDLSLSRWQRLTITPPVFKRTANADGTWDGAFSVTEHRCPGDNVAAVFLQFRSVKTKVPEEALTQVSGSLDLMEKQAEMVSTNCKP
jgi:hypothetical protein